MCGRFAQALPPRDYVDSVEDQVNRRRPRRQREEGEPNEAGDKGRKKAGLPREPKGKQVDETTQNGEQDTTKADEGPTVVPVQSLVREEDYHPTHNVAPGVRVPIVRLEHPAPFPGHDSSKTSNISQTDSSLLVQCMRWGLLPHHTTSVPRGPDAMRTINARDDAVLSGRSMWTPILRSGKRCVVFCQGFFEWLKKDDGAQRIAHFVGMKDEGNGRTDVHGKRRALMPMAGLWERCTVEGQEILSFTIITTESNKQLNFLHDRMPVILPDHRAIRVWLGVQPASPDEICKLLKPYDAGQLECYPVPREVGRVGTDNANFILPVSARKDGIEAAFGRMKRADTIQIGKGKAEEGVNTETNAPMDEEIKAADEQAKQAKQTDLSSPPAPQPSGKRDQSEEDHLLARKLQEEEYDMHQNKRQRSATAQETVQQGKHDANPDTQTRRPPSSKWSPDPYNPPLSPPRPQGGWSTVNDPDPAPYKRHLGGGQSGAMSSAKKRQLEESAKGTKDIRSFFGQSK